jgi:DNA-binding transcriptional regulator GbsR (MarR family)
MTQGKTVAEARQRLVEIGGRTSQDLGLGRVVGQMLMYLYLQEEERSLDQIGEDLGLSKAAASVAARQLESLGLLHRCWKKGDRRSYYRTADNIATALQQGLFRFLARKVRTVGEELDHVHGLLAAAADNGAADAGIRFMVSRVERAKSLRRKAERFIGNPLVKVFIKA